MCPALVSKYQPDSIPAQLPQPGDTMRTIRADDAVSLECLQIRQDVMHIVIAVLVQQIAVRFQRIVDLEADSWLGIELPAVMHAGRVRNGNTEIVNPVHHPGISLSGS